MELIGIVMYKEPTKYLLVQENGLLVYIVLKPDGQYKLITLVEPDISTGQNELVWRILAENRN